MFWENFWPNFWSNIFADGLIIGTVLLLTQRYFNKKDEKQKESEKEERRKENLRVSVNMLWSEIEDNRKQLNSLIENLSKRPKPNLVYPALETSVWEIIDRHQLIDGLKPEDSSNLLHIYNRTYTANKMYYSMLDKINWVLAGDQSTVRDVYIDAIVDRAKELLDFINEVIPQNLIKKIKNE